MFTQDNLTYRNARFIGPGAAMLASGIIGGASSLLGNIFGSSSQSSTNRTNLRIAQMNNEFNERMLQKQMDYNDEMFEKQTAYDTQKWQDQLAAENQFTEKMWNKTNQWNSAGEQRKRLEQAGLNPYLMMNGGSAGTAQSASSSSPSGGSPSAMGINPPTATPVQVQAFRPDFSGINQVVSSYMDYLKTRDLNAAQTANVATNTEFLPKLLWSQIFANDAETFNKNVQSGRMQALLPYEINQAQQDIFTSQVQQAVMRGDLINTILDANLKQKALDTYDERFRAEMSVYSADVYQKVQAGLLSEKEAELAVEKKLTEIETREGIKTDNKTKKDMSYWLIRGSRWSAIEQSWNAKAAQENAHIQGKENSWYWWNRTGGALLGTILPGVIGFGLGRFGGKAKPVKGFGR